MAQVLKKYILYAILIGIVYALLAYHYIYTGGENIHVLDSIQILKKETLNLRYTFFSIKSKKPELILKIDVLRYAGIGDILVDYDLMTEAQREELENKYDSEEEEE
jgi:hypothetical protein